MAYLPILNPMPIIDLDAIISGTITVTDALGGTPSGTGVLINTAPTANSFIALLCPGGDSAWNVQVTGLTAGTLYFEESLDSTTGSDGSWIVVNGRQAGVINTNVSSNTTTNGYYRGNTSGAKWFRVRSVGALTGTPTVVIRISSGSGALFLNASIPAGLNSIGAVTQGGTWNIGAITTLPALPIGTNSIGAVTQGGTWNIGAITTLPSLVAGAAEIGRVRITDGTNLATVKAGVISVAGDTALVVTMHPSSAPSVTQPVSQSGTWTQTSTPATPTPFTLSSAATTNLTSVKASAGTLYGVTISNVGAAVAFLKLYNKATAPAVATDIPVYIMSIPAGAVVTNINLGALGHRFSTGIAFAITNLVAYTDATVVAAGQVQLMLDYI